MKRTLILSVFGILVAICAFGQTKVDTLYYDKDWKGVADRLFAAYVRVAVEPDDPHFAKRCRDFYVTGEVQGESNFISIDKYDDSKSVFDGEWTTYFKSGNVCEHGYRVNGVMDGEYSKYDEDGYLIQHAYYKDGQLDGAYTEFVDDIALYKVIDYENGTIIHDYYTVTNFNGLNCKVSFFDDQPIAEETRNPALTDVQVEYVDDQEWQLYDMNGIVLAVSMKKVEDYGKYFQINMSLTNNTLTPIDFGIQNISAYYNSLNDKFSLGVLSASDYIAIVSKKQKRKMSSNRFWEHERADALSTTTSTTNTSSTTTNSGTTSSYANASATSGSYGSTVRGSAYGTSNYNGSSTTNTSTTTYTSDAMAKQIAYDRAQSNIEDFNNQLLSDREALEDAYLKRTTINAGETSSGFVNIDYAKYTDSATAYRKVTAIVLSIEVNGYNYIFSFNL
ncbi:MAG: hypothetical protein LUC91_07500 [Prevotella sp.]|nr:hypothetical protein [Prevotella sp.]